MKEKFPELELILEVIVDETPNICHRWVSDRMVIDIFDKANIGLEKFEKLFAPKIVEYFIGVASNEKKIGNCPVIGIMLSVFHKADLQINEIFMICVTLKNIMAQYAVSAKNTELYDEIAKILDGNFEGVIKEYVNIQYYKVDKRILCKHGGNRKCDSMETINTINTMEESLIQSVPIQYPTESEKLHDDFYKNKIGAEEFCALEPIDEHILHDLMDFENDFEPLIYSNETLTEELLGEIPSLLSLYLSAINTTVEFKLLYGGITDFSNSILSINYSTINDEQKELYYTMIKSVLNDLITWKDEVYIKKEIKDIHYLDDSILSSIIQFQSMVSGEDIEAEEIEFF